MEKSTVGNGGHVQWVMKDKYSGLKGKKKVSKR